MAYGYGSTYGHEDDPSYGPDNIGDPINLDPLAGINENRPKFRTRKQQQRAERYAQALEQDASSTAPLGSPWQAGAQVLKGVMAGLEEREIDQSDAARRDYLTKALEGDTSPDDLMKQGALYDVPELSDIGKYQAETDWRRQQAETEQGWKQKGYDFEREKFDFTKNQPYEVGGNLVERGTFKPLYESPDSPSTVVNTGGDNDSLRKELSKREGETWSGYQEKGAIDAGAIQDMETVDELLKQAPQGPITGRLATAFPGFSSAGDAANAILSRIAPTLRTPGSGAQSDIEYEGFVRSLPKLANQPGANQIISGVIKAKAALNVERGNIVSAFQNGEIDEVQARTALAEVNKRSIMTPEMKQLITPSTGGTTLDPETEDLVKKYGG
jgi:hypothetical protein